MMTSENIFLESHYQFVVVQLYDRKERGKAARRNYFCSYGASILEK